MSDQLSVTVMFWIGLDIGMGKPVQSHAFTLV